MVLSNFFGRAIERLLCKYLPLEERIDGELTARVLQLLSDGFVVIETPSDRFPVKDLIVHPSPGVLGHLRLGHTARRVEPGDDLVQGQCLPVEPGNRLL